jgi:glycosyltransferase involved in cell wall biosynthesis
MKRIVSEFPSENRRLCVVVPVHNEADNLAELVKRLQAVAGQLHRWEIDVLFVDDGSTDASVEKIREIRAGGIPVGYIRLSKNFGHQAALCAGMEQALGDAVITMDSDLQHPPEEIPRMLDAHEEGADVVQMVRTDSADAKAGKGFFSTWFYRTFNRMSDTRIVPNAADFRLMSRPVVDALLRIPEREKFLRGLIPSLGFRQVSLEFHEAERLHGMPSYSFRMSFRMARKALFDYSTLPLRFVFWFGMTIAIVSYFFGMGHFIYKLLNWNKVVPGFTDIITAIFFLSGAILASVGIVGRYLMMILDQVRHRPAFIVMEQVSGMPLTRSFAELAREERISIASKQ